jgi:pimeloyl-ACP methyl ester carboxylesterase
MPHSDKFLLTVHGVNSNNDGLKTLRDRCVQNLQGLLVDSFFYGKVIPFKELTGPVCQFIFRTVRDKLDLINRTYLIPETRKCFIVAHSFGTLAVVRALEMHVPDLKVEALILLGSIVPREYHWDGMVASKCLAGPPLAIVRPCEIRESSASVRSNPPQAPP